MPPFDPEAKARTLVKVVHEPLDLHGKPKMTKDMPHLPSTCARKGLGGINRDAVERGLSRQLMFFHQERKSGCR
eukprot:267488-Amphidinium_carterae.1